MKLYLTRHGQTDWNVQRKVCGRSEAHLTDFGRQQAAQMAGKVAETGVNLILTSPMERTRDTARIVAGRIGVPVMMEPRLIEQDFGSYEGRNMDDPEYLAQRENLLWHFPGGESTVQVIHRAYAVLEDVGRKYAGKTVLLVTHGCFCRAARTYFMDVAPGEYYQFYMNNCDLLEFEL